ncbi:hypothetical protein KM043_002574 [Ampulex compressa]|nr:hypothetical protein KM043_002574 [Ampulex compressa]
MHNSSNARVRIKWSSRSAPKFESTVIASSASGRRSICCSECKRQSDARNARNATGPSTVWPRSFVPNTSEAQSLSSAALPPGAVAFKDGSLFDARLHRKSSTRVKFLPVATLPSARRFEGSRLTLDCVYAEKREREKTP